MSDNLDLERELADEIVQRLPADEEELAVSLCISRDRIASACSLLQRQSRITVDRRWDTPTHWMLSP